MTTITLTPNGSAWVRSNTPTENHGYDSFMSTGRWPNGYNTGTHITQGLWRFQGWEKIPAGAIIDSAVLLLYAKYITTSNVLINTIRNAGNWNWQTVNWDTKPSAGSLISGDYVNAGWNAWTVTSYVQAARFSSSELRTYGIRTVIGSDAVYGADFWDEHVEYSQHIDVNYHANPPTISSLTTNNNNFILKGTNAAGTRTVVTSSATSGGTYSNEGYATGGSSWTFSDPRTAPAPGDPSPSVAIVNGNDIKINWTLPSQSGITRHYKCFTVLDDGTTSGFSSSVGNLLTPSIVGYEIQRRTLQSTGTYSSWSLIASGTYSGREFIDTTLPTGTKAQYRVIAINSQTRNSPGIEISSGIIVVPPPAPVISSVTLENNNSFKVSGSKAPLTNISGGSRSIRILASSDGINYVAAAKIDTPTTDDWSIVLSPGAGGFNPATSPPNAPNISITYNKEKEISVGWNYSGLTPNTGTRRYFKAENIVDGVVSNQSAAGNNTLFPSISSFRVDRKIEGLSDSFYSTIYPISGQISKGSDIGYTDANVQFGEKYIYRVYALNSFNQISTAITKNAATQIPNPPTVFPAKELINSDKSRKIRISGKDRNLAPAMFVQKQNGTVWSDIPSAVNFGTSTTNTLGEEWWIDDNSLNVSKPSVVNWSLGPVPVDTGGIYLRWTEPANPSLISTYRAFREMPGANNTPVRSNPSTNTSKTITPYVTSYTIHRMTKLKTGEIPTVENEFRQIATVLPAPGDETPPTFFNHTDPLEVESERTYVYKISATNNFGKTSTDSAEITISTFDRPPEIIPAPPIPPMVSKPRPSGAINISGGGTIRFVWDYFHLENLLQKSYSLKATYVENGIEKSMHWSKNGWTNTGPVFINSSNNFVDVNISEPDGTQYFKNGINYKLNLKVRSQPSIGTVSINALEGESTTLEWEITGAEAYTVYFPTQRVVKRTYTSYFDLYRKVINTQDTALGLPTLAVSWNVEPQLPLEVDDETWEGGGNSWIHTVFDYEGRPEPYAEIDFEKENYTRSFKCDSRGRIVLKIPDDVEPGIYTFRERGPSMAPRTTKDFSVVDPWLIYSHGKRHSIDGPDPIFGITNKQIADDANIHPSKLEGGESLGRLVDAYGSDMQEGLERVISAGHGFYVVEGLNIGVYTNGSSSISAGVCWENERLREIGAENISFLSDGTFKVFVLEGKIRIEQRNSHPPKSTPLYTVIVSNSLLNATITDDRISHPNLSTPTSNEPIRWGAGSTDDIVHNDDKLVDVIKSNIDTINNRKLSEEDLHNKFFNSVKETSSKINNYNLDISKSRETLLSIGYAGAMKQLYSIWNKKASENLLLDNSSRLQEAGMIDVISYLSAIKNSGINHNSSHISAFQTKDELSSLTNLLIVNGLGRLPNNWTKDTQYTLRTLRIEGAPAKILEFHLAYEDTKAKFDILGSQSSNGRYLPKKMTNLRTVKDDNLKQIFGTVNNCYISTYRAVFDEPGDESTIELLCYGGNPGDGVRLRGFAIVAA